MRFLEAYNLNLLKVIQNVVTEKGIVTPLIMWNIKCIRDKLVFEGTQLGNTSTFASNFFIPDSRITTII